jgi:hypothetical protein
LVNLAVIASFALGWLAPAALADAKPYTNKDRMGVNVWGDITQYDLRTQRIAWYLDWTYRVNPARPSGLRYVQVVRVGDSFWPPDWAKLEQAIAANPGSSWLIGNEPDHPNQDNCTPVKYAERYAECYTFIKTYDATAQVSPAGITQVTPLRLRWLDAVLAAYAAAHANAALPADFWNIHVQTLCETAGYGAGAPPGLEAFQATEGRCPTVEDAANVEVFTAQVVDFRTWMLQRGYRNRRLIISEFGVLQPSGCFYLGWDNKAAGDEMVRAYMNQTHAYLLSARSSTMGLVSDRNRLVQEWAWYSLDAPMSSDDCSYINSANGSLYQYQAPHAMTGFGQHYRSSLLGALNEFGAPLAKLSIFGPNAGGWTDQNTFPRLLGDVNGDGRADIVAFGNNYTFVSLSTGNGFAAPVSWIKGYGVTAGGWTDWNTFPRLLGDVNGDGKDDIVAFGNKATYVSLSTGTRFLPAQQWIGLYGPQAGGWVNQDTFPRWVGDVNGDGRADIIAFGNNATYVSLSTGTRFGPPQVWLRGLGVTAGGWSSQNQFPRLVADVDGDGRADVVAFGNKATYVARSTGSGFVAPKEWIYGFGYAASADAWTSQRIYARTVADVNGDGLADIVGFGDDGVYVSYSTGTGFWEIRFGVPSFGPSAGGWVDHNIFPRWAGDVNGDGNADIVGFGNKATYLSLHQ